MFATGRKPKTKNLGLEAVGVKLSKKGAIEVDEFSQTSVPSIRAVGDVADRINLTPVALMEGGALAKNLFANKPTKPDHREVPSAVFSQTSIGQVVLTEEQATKEYGDVDVYNSNFRPLKATISDLPDRVFMKLIVCAKTNKFLGLHVWRRFTRDRPGIHPTVAEELVTMRTPTRTIRSAPFEIMMFLTKVCYLITLTHERKKKNSSKVLFIKGRLKHKEVKKPSHHKAMIQSHETHKETEDS